jgi:negative regulator of flagellin synthesis FlgM
MKINGNSDPLRLDRSGNTSKGDKAGKPEASAGETVQLSGLSSQLAKLVDDTQAPTAVFDQSRVDAIKDAMRRGEFHVDSGVVADKLIQSAQELIAKKD